MPDPIGIRTEEMVAVLICCGADTVCRSSLLLAAPADVDPMEEKKMVVVVMLMFVCSATGFDLHLMVDEGRCSDEITRMVAVVKVGSEKVVELDGRDLMKKVNITSGLMSLLLSCRLVAHPPEKMLEKMVAQRRLTEGYGLDWICG